MNTARSALSSIIAIDGTAEGCHPLVARFMKGVYNLKPPAARYKGIWDVSVVLRHLRTLHPLSALSLKSLSHKLVMLLALTTAQRLQTHHILDIGLMTIEPNYIVFCFDSPLKQSNPRNSIKPLIIRKYSPDKRLCAYTVLQEYLRRTEAIRGNENQLLISHQRPFRKISRDSISRWLNTVLKNFGVKLDQFKAHSTRSASTSAAKKASVPMQ